MSGNKHDLNMKEINNKRLERNEELRGSCFRWGLSHTETDSEVDWDSDPQNYFNNNVNGNNK